MQHGKLKLMLSTADGADFDRRYAESVKGLRMKQTATGRARRPQPQRGAGHKGPDGRTKPAARNPLPT